MLAKRNSIGKLFPIILTLLAIFIEGNHSEIVILHRLKKTTVFNTSDDIEIRASFSDGKQHGQIVQEKAYLCLSEPLDACAILKSPPSLPSTNYYSSDESSPTDTSIPQVKWVALITSGGGCDLKTKAVFAAQAGYVRVIVKITHAEDVYGFNSLYDDEEIQVDISLLNPSDWDLIQKYVHPKPYVILLPLPNENARPRTASRRLLFLSSTFESIYDFVYILLNFPYTVVDGIDYIIFRCLKELVISPLKLDTLRFREAAYAFICFLIPACMILGPFFAVLIYFSEPTQRPRAPQFFDFEDDPSRNRSVSTPNSNVISQYRGALGLRLFEPLVKRNIESAYKRKALKCHPDKNLENQVEATNQFIIITAAREELLKLVEPEE
ncbi:DnaJ subfamily C member 21 [Orchesella cincta]|uniref:DnaJ subfamily C member 21 n=1 Tax=Orchesella cincta TaxID=48709 RepID=A0A1D2MQ91_ORCCI|nr:DnaJ subfamily C member 21 [Orchesella cincta]